MKKYIFTLTLMFIGALVMVTPVAAQPQGITTVTLDNFCDGLTLNVVGPFVSGTHDNWDCLGGVGDLNGSVSTIARVYPSILRGKPMVAVGDSIGVAALGCPVNFYLDFSTLKWSVYYSCAGEPEVLLNRGTFTMTSPAFRGRAGRPSTLRIAGSVVDDSDPAAAPAGPYTIALDNFCDFFLVNTSGNKMGAIHDVTTNCGDPANFVAVGNNQKQAAELTGTAGDGAFLNSTVSSLFDVNACVVNYYFSFSNNTWANYLTCSGSAPTAINFGTFTLTSGTAKPANGSMRMSIKH